MKIDLLVKFSVTKEIDEKDKLIGVSNLLVDNEMVELAYKHISIQEIRFGLLTKD